LTRTRYVKILTQRKKEKEREREKGRRRLEKEREREKGKREEEKQKEGEKALIAIDSFARLRNWVYTRREKNR